MKSIEQVIKDNYPGIYNYPNDSITLPNRDFVNMVIEVVADYVCQKPDKEEYRNLYTTLARAVESGDPLVIGLTVGQVVERLKTLSE